jgi:Cu/Ag efflux protein CusF
MTILNLRYRILLAAFPLYLLLLGLATDVQAEGAEPHHQTITSTREPLSSSVTSYTLQGVVVQLQGEQVVLNHQAVAALNWPAMTMPFQLANAELAQGLTPGLHIEAQFVPVANDSPRILHWQAVK